MRFTEDEIKRAKEVNMLQLLSHNGIKYQKKSKRDYCIEEHDSLLFGEGNNGLWGFIWHSQGIKGDIIQFVMTYFNKSFPDAIRLLLEESHSAVEFTSEVEKYKKKKTVSKPFKLPELADNTDRAFDFLVNVRLIDDILVMSLLDSKQILQQKKYCNVLFPAFDHDGKLVGVEVRGTYQQSNGKYYKGTVEGSNINYGFKVQQGDTVETLYFYESALDLLSFLTLMPNVTNALLISMSGLRDSVVGTYVKAYPDASIYFCVDNDKWGKEFADKMKTIYTNSEYWIMDNNTSNAKDWNDYMKFYKQTHKNEILYQEREIS